MAQHEARLTGSLKNGMNPQTGIFLQNLMTNFLSIQLKNTHQAVPKNRSLPDFGFVACKYTPRAWPHKLRLAYFSWQVHTNTRCFICFRPLTRKPPILSRTLQRNIGKKKASAINQFCRESIRIPEKITGRKIAKGLFRVYLEFQPHGLLFETARPERFCQQDYIIPLQPWLYQLASGFATL